MTSDRLQPRPPRVDPREVAELKQIKAEQPDLASAVDMQIALLELQRRVQARVPMPWLEIPAEWIERLRQGKPLLHFEDLPLDWTEFRLMLRQTADILQRYGALEPADHAAIQSIGRTGNALPPLVLRWYNLTAAPGQAQPADLSDAAAAGAAISAGMLEQVLALAMRPFLARAAEILLSRPEIAEWRHAYCPLCGGEPEFAVITPAADRLLICGRCTGQWRFDPLACPFCQNAERSLITSFASRDGKYRIYACDVCRRYLKAFDARRTRRPVSLAVDSVATLPLDAAAIQKGYRG
jgi:formate dehydrogenase formation protein